MLVQISRSKAYFSATILFFLLLFMHNCFADQEQLASRKPGAIELRARLLAEFDSDNDKKITLADFVSREEANAAVFKFSDESGVRQVRGFYALSNLLQELSIFIEDQTKGSDIPQFVYDPEKINERPADRASRLIRERFWDGLTRRIDLAEDSDVLANLVDSKNSANSEKVYLYVPFSDQETYQDLRAALNERTELKDKLTVYLLPRIVTPEYVLSLTRQKKHGLLMLASEKVDGERRGLPYVVPGGRFNEMYGWDSYFVTLGLLADSKVDLAKSMVTNFAYQIEHYGQILNANRTYYLTRSQPPFMTSMIRSVWKEINSDGITVEERAWFSRAVKAALKEYLQVWTDPRSPKSQVRVDGKLTGLSRYYGTGLYQPPETEQDHFKEMFSEYRDELATYLKSAGKTVEGDLSWKDVQGFYQKLKKEPNRDRPTWTSEIDEFFVHDRCIRESGHDTTFRFMSKKENTWKEKCADFAPVALNSLLYKAELDLALIARAEFPKGIEFKGKRYTEDFFLRRLSRRKTAMETYLYNPKLKIFTDFQFTKGRHSDYLAPVSLYPLWAWDSDAPKSYSSLQLVKEDQAGTYLYRVIPHLIQKGGLSATAKDSFAPFSEKKKRQWEYPVGWAPHQMIAWRALDRYGTLFSPLKEELSYRWAYTIVRNFHDYNATITEKYDVVNTTHEVFAEYGNVGSRFDYIAPGGFGWMNASLQLALENLTQEQRRNLNELVPPRQASLFK